MRPALALFSLTYLLNGQQTPPVEKTVAFRGLVTDVSTGLPFEGVSIELTLAPASIGAEARSFKATSNAKGEVTLDVPSGGLGVTATREGYSMDPTSARIVLLTETATPQVFAVKMIRSSMISGVTEDEDGKPVAGISLELIDPVTQRTLRAVGGADGSFRIGPVNPGKYVLRGTVNLVQTAADRLRPRMEFPAAPYGLTYYPSTPDPESSAQLVVYAGLDIPGLRLRMRKATYYTISGRVVGREANPSPAALVRLQGASRSYVANLTPVGEARIEAPIAPDGTFRIERVLAGDYRAVLYTGGTGLAQFSVGSSLVSVTNRDVDDLTLAVMPGGKLAGRIVMENGEPSKRGGILVGRNEIGNMVRLIQLSSDGRFFLDGVAAGTYFLSGGPVTTIEIGGRTFEGGTFEFAPPVPGDMVVTVSAQGATIQGNLQDAKNPDKPVIGVGSVMRLAALTDRFDESRVVDLNRDGSFSASYLAPGKYLVCAWSDASTAVSYLLQWTAVPLQRLEQQCKTVTLKPNGSEQVQVKMTSIADVTR